MTAAHKTFCRYCHAQCAVVVDVEDGRPLRLRGDVDDPVFGGYTCMKGRELPTLWDHPQRLRATMKREADGRFAPLPVQTALDEIAQRLAAIRERHGPRSIATYCGTYAFMNAAAVPVAAGFMKGLGSPSFYTPVTIDQPGKVYTWARVGQWMGGLHGFDDADVLMMLGNNPLTSHYAPPCSLPAFSPSRRLRDALQRGLKLIVVDPRRTPTAKLAQLHLQIRPGEDATLLAGLLRIIFDENLHDRDFCARHIDHLDRLRAALERFTPDYVARRAAVPQAALVDAARLFARGPRGIAASGTGPEMAGRGSLTEFLIIALNSVCGRYCREGEIAPIPRVLTPPTPRKAQVLAPQRLWGEGFVRSRVRGLTQLGEEMPTATLADEILTPGEGQVRALIVVGGNPLVAWPNQDKVRRALAALDLLVSIDIRMAQTACLAHYVIAPKLCLEREDITSLSEWWHQEPYARYTEAVCAPPPGEFIDEWEVFWELARRLGTGIPTLGGPLPLDRRPSSFEVLDHVTRGCRVPLDQVRAATRNGAAIFESARVRVAPADPGHQARLELMPEGVDRELAALRAEPLDGDGKPRYADFDYSHLLCGRRAPQFYNSSGHELDALRRKGVTNPAFLHPDDLAAARLQEGELLEIESRCGRVLAVAAADPGVKPGVISMTHAFGDVADTPESVRAQGATTSRLVDDTWAFDPITGHTRQSAIPVRIRRHGPGCER
jgi:anaerobic selenocysteine-containing dehydrogenase